MDRHTAEPSVGEVPGDAATRWVEYYHDHAATSTHAYDFVWDVTGEAEGPFCTDVDGNVLLDFTSHVAASPLGYNNPKIMDRLEEFDLVDPLKIAGADFYVGSGDAPGEADLPGPNALLDRLTDATAHYGLDTVFLSNSGAEAVENAIKISYADGGHRGVTFDGAFHGRTLGALSLNRSKAVHRRGYPEVPGIVEAPYCACEGECTCGWRTDGPGGNVVADMLHPEQGSVDPGEVAYLILEPVQGEGGYRIPSERFVDDVAHISERYGVTVVADEVQSGIGRTGEMWGVDHTPIDPDVIASAKGLRVGATIAAEETFPDEQGRISSTWGSGAVLDSMVGALTLEAIEEHDLMDNAVVRGEQLRQLLADADHDCVVDVRNRGLMFAVEFDGKDRRDDVVEAGLKRGLLTLSCGHKTLRVLPPLDVTEREIELGADLLNEAIDAAAD